MGDTLTTPIKTTTTRSRSGTTTSTLLVSPSLLRVASSSSTSTVRVSKDHAGQSGLRDDHQVESLDDQAMLGVPGPSTSRTPSLIQRTSGSARTSRSGSRERRSSRDFAGRSSSGSSSSSPSRIASSVVPGQHGTGGSGLEDVRIGLKRLISRETQPVPTPVVSPIVVDKGKGKESKGKSLCRLDVCKNRLLTSFASIRQHRWLFTTPVLHPHSCRETGVRLVSSYDRQDRTSRGVA